MTSSELSAMLHGHVSRLHHTGLTVTDLDRSISFYSNVLGCEVLAMQEKQGGYLAAIVGYPDAHVRMAHLQLPGSDHVIELFQYLTPLRESFSLEPAKTGITHLCFVVRDLNALYQRLRNAGIDSFLSTPVAIDTGVNRGGMGLYFRDPDGIYLELFEPPPTE